MKTSKFITGELPKGFKIDFEPFLFNGSAHRKLQAEKGWVAFHCLDEAKKKLVARIFFHLDGTLAQSPVRAPFGGMEFSDKLQPREFSGFIKYIEHTLGKLGAKKMVVRNPPGAYMPYASPWMEVILQNLGFNITQAAINTSIVVDEIEFEKKIEAWELRKLKQSRKSKLSFVQLPLSSMEKVYEFILACRQEREQSLSMTLDEVKKTMNKIPGNFFLFGVYQKKELMAAAITIAINSEILYNFYSAHPRKFDQLSPVVLLTEGMYHWCRERDIALLDLGTSALGDQPNFGLLEFKHRLGGTFSPKLTFTKDLV